MQARYERLLPFVEKPGRYVGGERGAVVKDPSVGTAALRAGVSRGLRNRAIAPRAADSLRHPEPPDRRLLRARLRPMDRHGAAAPRQRSAAGVARNQHAARVVPHRRLQPPVRAHLHERPRDARPGGNSPAGSGAWPRTPADHRRRTVRVQSRAARAVPRRGGARRRRGGRRRHRRRAHLDWDGSDRSALLRGLAAIDGVYVPSHSSHATAPMGV